MTQKTDLLEMGKSYSGHLETQTEPIPFTILGSDEYDSLSEEERGNSRPQMWSKYPLDVQKEFGYDSPHDLDSD